MRLGVLVVFSLIAITSIQESGGIPLRSDSAMWHKITKRDTAVVAPSNTGNTNNSSSKSSTNENQGKESDKTETGNADELIETQPDSPLQESPIDDSDPSASLGEKVAEEDSDPNSERSIDWQLLSGNPADLERELESRRRRRSVRSSSLSRQHRIRTTGGIQRSRSKRDTYYSVVNPSDLLAAYAYLQARRQEQEEEQPQLSLLGDVSDGDLSNLATLIYDLQRADDGAANDNDADEEDQQALPSGYVEFEPTNDYEPEEIRISPEQLAALEQVLSEQQENEDDDDEETGLYPKDKRSLAEPMFVDDDVGDDQDEEEETEDESEPVYLIPASLEPSTEYVQIPLAETYDPYNFYEVDEDAARRIDEEQLRERIASLIEDINEQRRIGQRRRRR